jgi:hypothetical protein
MSTQLSQAFWDSFREDWRMRLRTWKMESSNVARGKANTALWTEFIKRSAEEACHAVARQFGRHVNVGRERHGRLDVHAVDAATNHLFIAYESELAYWGYNGDSGRDWRQEFPKLCSKSAELRVLSSTFPAGTGASFEGLLLERLRSMRTAFDQAEAGEFCLIFGPEDTRSDPTQPWVAYSLMADFTLYRLDSTVPLLPRNEIDYV